MSNREQVSDVSDEDLERIRALLRRIGGSNVTWGASSELEVWIIESRMESERKASQRLLVATWALVAATIGLVIATAGLIVFAT